MKYRTRKMIKSEDLNGRNTLFGGRLLEWIDEECFVYTSCQLNSTQIVTKYMSELNFANPGHQGDVIEIGVEITEVGNTSITLQSRVRNKMTKELLIEIDKIIFVNLDDQGKPKPHGLSLEVNKTH